MNICFSFFFFFFRLVAFCFTNFIFILCWNLVTCHRWYGHILIHSDTVIRNKLKFPPPKTKSNENEHFNLMTIYLLANWKWYFSTVHFFFSIRICMLTINIKIPMTKWKYWQMMKTCILTKTLDSVQRMNMRNQNKNIIKQIVNACDFIAMRSMKQTL